VIHSLGYGGAERVLTDLVKNLDSRAYEIAVCTFYDPPGFRTEIEEANIEVHFLEKKRRLDVALVVRLARLMRKLKPDVVSMHCRDAFNIGTPASMLARIPTRIATEHSVGSGRSQFLNRLAFTFFSRRWNATIAVSQFLKDFMVQTWGIPTSRIRVIYNGIDLGRVDYVGDRNELRRVLGLSSQALIVGNVGTLKIEKGHGAFLEAASRIASKNEAVHFVMIGDGPLMNDLADQARQLGISSRTHFMGARTDAVRLAAGFDVFLSTSNVETFGLAAVEAMLLGVPIVGFDVGSMREIVTDKENGFLVSPRDTSGAAERVLSLLEDAYLRESMGKRARVSAESRFSLPVMIDHYSQLLSAR